MTDGRNKGVLLAVLALLLIAALGLWPSGEFPGTTASTSKDTEAAATSTAVVATTASAPPIERVEAPPTSVILAPPTAKREDAIVTESYAVRDLVFGANAMTKTSDLAETIRLATEPTYWRESNRSLAVEDSGVLMVSANSDMHRKVAAILRDMRRTPPRSR